DPARRSRATDRAVRRVHGRRNLSYSLELAGTMGALPGPGDPVPGRGLRAGRDDAVYRKPALAHVGTACEPCQPTRARDRGPRGGIAHDGPHLHVVSLSGDAE